MLTHSSYGAVYFLDHSYNQVYNVCQADLNIVKIPGIQSTQNCLLDLHESRMTSRGVSVAIARESCSRASGTCLCSFPRFPGAHAGGSADAEQPY